MIVVAYLVGAVAVLVAVISEPTAIGTVFPLVVTAATVATVAVLVVLRRRANLQWSAAEIRRSESVVVTGLVDTPRRDVAELIGELRRLGFSTVGATDTSIGGGAPIRTWVLTERAGSGTTWIEVGMVLTAIAVCLSRAGNGRFLETPFRRGEMIDHPDLFVRPVWAGVDVALREHRATLAEWTSQSGPPLAARTLDDYRRVETELRDRTGGMRIATYIERVVEPSLRRWAVSAVIGIITLLAVVLLPGP